MKKVAVSGLLLIIFSAYIVYLRTNNKDVVVPLAVQESRQNVSNAAGQKSSIPENYSDGEYISSVGDAYFGPLQIKLVISGGRISDIQFLKYPNDRPTSVMINEQALPILKQEAIQAQNENVDIVTGATQTAEAFQLLLKETLSKAKA